MELHPILEKGEWLSKCNLWYVVSARGEHPSMRVGQCCCHIPATDNSPSGGDNWRLGKLAVIGGANPNGPFDETHILDFDDYEWDEPELSGFVARYEHTAFVARSQTDKVIIFGGAQQDRNLNCIQSLDLATKKWSTISARGTAPSPRTCRGSTCDEDKLYVFCGGQQGSEPVPDMQLHVFDAGTQEWSQLPAKGKTPKARHGHVMAAVNGRIYVHGGMAGSTMFNDMHEYDLKTNTWKLIKCKGDVPLGRAAHACVSHGKKIFIFGGMTQTGASDEAFIFNTGNSRWTKFNPEGPPPAPRLDHAMCLVTLPCPKRTASASAKMDKGSTSGAQDSSLPSGATAPSTSSVSDGVASASSDPARTAEEFLSSCVDAAAEQVTGGASESTNGGSEVDGAGAAAASEEKEKELVLCCVVQGGMDTQGEIFDDCLLLRLDSIL